MGKCFNEILMYSLCVCSSIQLSLLLHKSLPCEDLIAYYCSTAEVMGQIQSMLYATLKENHPDGHVKLCGDWIADNLSGYSADLKAFIATFCPFAF